MSELVTNISVVPNGIELIDMALSRSIPKSTTILHPNVNITTLRNYFIRRLRLSAAVFEEKLGLAVDEFPKFLVLIPIYDRICHIFDPVIYMNALYMLKIARDHFRKTRKLIAKLLKRSDSLTGLKCLSVFFLGAMSSYIRKIAATLVYLEKVRPHLVAFPSLDPNAETIDFLGYPGEVISAHILQWLDRLEQIEGLSQADEGFGTSNRDLNPEEEAALVLARIKQRFAQSRPNITSNATPSEM